MKKTQLKNLCLSAMLLALGFVLPFLTGQVQQIGNMLLPMHIPVLLCGVICGWQYGAAVGFILPLLRSLTLSMPPLFPNAVAMALELAAYGFLIGFIYSRFRSRNLLTLYVSLISAMVGGRVVWGAAMALLLGISSKAFTWQAFAAGAVLNAVPGIIVQLILIPAIMLVLDKTGLVKFGGHAE